MTSESINAVLKTKIVGFLIHGIYLGSTFYAMANGLGAALAALILSMQPLLTTAMAIFLLMKNQIVFNGLVFLSAFRA